MDNQNDQLDPTANDVTDPDEAEFEQEMQEILGGEVPGEPGDDTDDDDGDVELG